MNTTELQLAAIANVASWYRMHRRNFLDEAGGIQWTRRHFDHLPATVVVCACLIAQDDADAGFWQAMEDDIADAGPMTEAMDAAFKKEIDGDPIPF